MLINCFPFFNEIDLLLLRLEYEYSFYDKFLIVEGTKTFAGQPKILYFEKYKHLFSKFLGKIQYHVVDDFPEVIKQAYITTDNKIASEYRWHLTKHHKNSILTELMKMSLSDNDLILVSDLDEIVNIDKLKDSIENINDSEVHRYELLDYRYSVALEPISERWIGPYLTKYKHLRKMDNIGHLRASSIPASNSQVFKYHAKTSLQAIFYLLMNGFGLRRKSGLSASVSLDSVSYLHENDFYTSDVPKDIILREAGIKKAVFHANSGWHFSHMSGGFKEIYLLKIQNFSHSEISTGIGKLDTEPDYYELLQNHIAKKRSDRLYDLESLDDRLPNFVKEDIAQFPVLLLPKDVDHKSFQLV